MIELGDRVDLMVRLGEYFLQHNPERQEQVLNAQRQNAWFTPDFVDLAVKNISEQFLNKEKLEAWISKYPNIGSQMPKTVGVVMAGNVPLVGFHDFLCVFISGHKMMVKLSGKDTVLWQHIFKILQSWNSNFSEHLNVSEMLKGCDAYIATGSDNSSRYFEYYFQKYPHIIRKNRTSVAVLSGSETQEMLDQLADDVCQFYGLGCRNVSQIYIPKDYDFQPLLKALQKYEAHVEHNKFKNNYDYQLALYLLNKQYYMSDGHLLLVENESPFAPISVLHFQYYDVQEKQNMMEQLAASDKVQCITTAAGSQKAEGKHRVFGTNQAPTLLDYADGVDTMAFLQGL